MEELKALKSSKAKLLAALAALEEEAALHRRQVNMPSLPTAHTSTDLHALAVWYSNLRLLVNQGRPHPLPTGPAKLSATTRRRISISVTVPPDTTQLTYR